MKDTKKTDDEEINRNLKLIAKSGFFVLFAVFFSKILVYAYRVVIARYYGSEMYGLFSLAIMISGIVVAIALFGLVEGILRFVPIYRGLKQERDTDYLLKSINKVVLISSLFAGILLFFLSGVIAERIFHNANLAIFLKIFSLLIPISVFSDVYIATIRAYEKIGWHSFLSYVFHNIIKILMLGLFVYLGIRGENAIAYSYLLGILGSLILAYFVVKKVVPRITRNEKGKLNLEKRRDIRKGLFSYSLPLLFSSIISLIFHWIDSFSLGFLKGAIEVGWYNAAIPIAALLSIAPELFIKLFFPIINREYSKKNIKIIEELSKQVTKWIFIINLPLMVLLILFPGAALNILFGKEYLAAETALRLLALGGLISSMFSIIPYRLISMTGRSKTLLINITIFGIVNVVLNFLLIPMEKIWFIENSMGLNGAAIATLISISLSSLLLTLQSRKYLSIVPLRRKMILIFASGAVAAFALFYVKKFVEINIYSLIVLSAFFVLSYIAIIFLTKGLDKNDLMIIRYFKSKIEINDKDT